MKIYDSRGSFERIVGAAKMFAKNYRHEYLLLEHFLLAVISEKRFHEILSEISVDVTGLAEDVDRYLAKQKSIVMSPDGDQVVKTSISSDRVCNRAFAQNYFHGGNGQVRLLDLFLSLTHEKQSHACYFLDKWGVNKDKVVEQWDKTSPAKENKVSGAIGEYCTNITELADEGKIDPVIGRQDVIAKMTQILARKNKCNVLLVGDPGTGKSAIAEGLALNICKGDVPEFLKGSTIYSINVGQLLAGAKYRGEFEERLNEILKAASEMEKCILFIDEAHQIHGAGASSNSSVDMGNMIKPYLARGSIKVIAATTHEEYFKNFEKDRALMRRFNKVDVQEPTAEVTKQILHGIKESYEEFHNVVITDDAISAAVDLSIRYQTDKRLPDKAIDLIDSACAMVRANDLDNNVINKLSIQEQICRVIPGMTLENMTQTAEQGDNFLNAKDKVLKVIYNQDEAVNSLFDQILLSRAGLQNPEKPIGSFLLRGPTGTGKTSVSQNLAKETGMHFMRIDMSEYMEKHSVSRLIGAPPGYVGFDDANLSGGILTSEIEKNPYTVLLIDEVEKAHPDIFNILLQVMDYGTLTSSNGKKINFRNVLLLMTTNLGAVANEKPVFGFGSSPRSGEEEIATNEFFSPEFRNRLDGVLTFNKLDKATIIKVAEKFVNELQSRLVEKEMTLEIDQTVWDLLVEKGYNPQMGARPMERAVKDLIAVPLSRKIVYDKLASGSVIKVTCNEEVLEFDIV